MQKIMNQLQQINNSSLAKVIFYKCKLQELIDELDFYNIIFAGNGVFIALKNEFGVSIGQVSNIKYSNNQLFKLDSPVIYPFIPKPPVSLFVNILEMFKYINNKSKCELCVNVYYHKTNKTFHTNIINQIIGSTTIKYQYNESFEMSDNYIRYLQIHSHNSMAANFSRIDNKDENYTTLCYYGVVGKITNNSKFYNVDMCYRIWNGIEFITLEFDDIFDTGVNKIPLENNIKTKLDNIIEISKIKEKENSVFISKNTPELFGRNSLIYKKPADNISNSISEFLTDNNLFY